ncbi:MAG TPA: CHRD domain-containing protein [Allosphingosinicella sp.]|nr:CHRD domain-containing protein [Allosphingosinicella sp.]
MTAHLPFAAALAAFATAAVASAGQPASPPDPEGGRPYTVALTGAAERPGPGDPDGSGTATLRINAGQGQVCYTINVANIDAATLAHIHRGAADAAGPVVVNLDPPADGSSEGCVSVARELAQELIRTPAGFYVNVHNAAFPNGAVRGQLAR